MGVTVMVAVLGLVPWLTAVNDGGYPVPEDARPMAGLEFVQLKLIPVGPPFRLLAGTPAPSFTVMPDTGFSEGRGVTVTVSVMAPVAHWPGAGVKV